MKILQHSWMLLVALFVTVNSSVADTVIWTESKSGTDTTSSQITIRVPAEHQIETRSVEVPAVLLQKIAARAMKVGNHHGQTLQLKGIHVNGDQIVVVGQRLVSRWKHQQRRPSIWMQEVRVSFPSHYFANSWDVQSLQRELERLGIKVKPKPAGPKPTQQLSG